MLQGFWLSLLVGVLRLKNCWCFRVSRLNANPLLCNCMELRFAGAAVGARFNPFTWLWHGVCNTCEIGHGRAAVTTEMSWMIFVKKKQGRLPKAGSVIEFGGDWEELSSSLGLKSHRSADTPCLLCTCSKSTMHEYAAAAGLLPYRKRTHAMYLADKAATTIEHTTDQHHAMALEIQLHPDHRKSNCTFGRRMTGNVALLAVNDRLEVGTSKWLGCVRGSPNPIPKTQGKSHGQSRGHIVYHRSGPLSATP